MRLIIMAIMLLVLVPLVRAECLLEVAAQNTPGFIAEIPALNEQVESCSPKLPSFITVLYSNAVFQVDVAPGYHFSAEIVESHLVGLEEGNLSEADYIASITEDDLDLILQSPNSPETALWLYNEGRITVESNGFFNTMRWWVAKPFLFFTARGASERVS